jgi:prepilin-type N-terminal cleavage/methylation domain-containing protein
LIERLRDQSGYSLVEVMVAIMILALAILPMVSMFDTGLRAASTSGNYDKARTLANMKLEEAKSTDYEAVRNSFPSGTSAPGSGGSVTSSEQTDDAPPGFSYTVAKQYIDHELSDSNTDQGMMKITVNVYWAGGDKSYEVHGVVSK